MFILLSEIKIFFAQNISGGVSTHRSDINLTDKINRTIKTCPGINDFLVWDIFYLYGQILLFLMTVLRVK